MKKFKSIIAQIKALDQSKTEELNDLLWQFICYSPQWPVRHHQQQLLDAAERFSFTIYDEHFSNQELNVNGFKWGDGENKVLLTHGWGSKAADFHELIKAVQDVEDITILSFDAPGNGSSDGELSNLLLYAAGVKGVVERYGAPDVAIGHSLGAMANVIALEDTPPGKLISLSPLIRLEENFIASLNALGIRQAAQQYFLDSFESRFNIRPSVFNMTDVYRFDKGIDHWLAYDAEDAIAPQAYLDDFLRLHPGIKAARFEQVGHEKMIRDERVIEGAVSFGLGL